MRRPPLLPILSLGALTAVVVLLAAWAIEARARQDEVLPRLRLAGVDVRGMDASELSSLVTDVAASLAAADIEVTTKAGEFRATTPEMGATVNVDATVASALRAGRTGSAPRRLWDWTRSLLFPRRARLVVEVDLDAVGAILAERDPSRVPPVEPFLVLEGGRLAGADGKPGEGARPETIVRALEAARPGRGTIKVKADTDSVPPMFSREDADRVAGKAEQLGAGMVSVKAGEQVVAVPAATFRLWVHAVPSSAGLRLGMKPSADVVGDLAKLLPDAGIPAIDASFAINAGNVEIVPGVAGMRCCGPATPTIIDAALASADGSKPIGPLELPLRETQPARDVEAAKALGIVELVGTFTTSHPAGQPRVANIHRMADVIRGTVIAPGEVFSINGIVGERTAEKGFVSAPIIGGDQRFDTDIGGGVSQLATTAFNAAFFGGLDITEYFMHGLYISRYPYAREATLSFPGPDFKFRNNTPYGVLVWPRYTDTSITIALYSTKFVSGEQTGQTVEQREPTFVPEELMERHAEEPLTCARVATERTRRFVADGRTVVDYFYALYSPVEGVLCR